MSGQRLPRAGAKPPAAGHQKKMRRHESRIWKIRGRHDGTTNGNQAAGHRHICM